MILDHLNLYVSDIPANMALFEDFLGFKRVALPGPNIAVLADDAGSSLVLINMKKASTFVYPDDIAAFHIGFSQKSREVVNKIHEKLTAEGFQPQAPREFHGSWTFYFKAPAGFFVEIFHHLAK
jgi:catechol 2,3-dioxygenase-like lactoylglutathione lyase family enzyme